MLLRLIRVAAVVLLAAAAATAQTANDPFGTPIAAADGVITVGVVEFASLPDVDGDPARMMLLVDEPGTGRLFVNDMRGVIYGVSYDGESVTPYLDLRAPRWAVSVQAGGNERGLQSFAFHPQFGETGTPGYGKLYTYTDTSNTAPTPDFVSGGGDDTHDTILLEWTAPSPGAATYDGGPPRELLRVEQPFRNHNGGQIGFNPLVSSGEADFGRLYIGSADGGSGGDPLDLSQNLSRVFGKIPAYRPARFRQRERSVRDSCRQSLRGRRRRARRDLRLRRAQSAALRVGLTQRQHVPRRHRAEHRRGAQSGHVRRQPRLERLGGEFPVHQPAGGQSHRPARGGRGDLSRSPSTASSTRSSSRARPPPASWCTVTTPSRS